MSSTLQSIGLLSVLSDKAFMANREELSKLMNRIGKKHPDRARIIAYLEEHPVYALMGCTRDLIGDRFEFYAGGMAIHSDGVYYWRGDAAKYVEEYGIGVTEDFMLHGWYTMNNWTPRKLSLAEQEELSRRIAREVSPHNRHDARVP